RLLARRDRRSEVRLPSRRRAPRPHVRAPGTLRSGRRVVQAGDGAGDGVRAVRPLRRVPRAIPASAGRARVGPEGPGQEADDAGLSAPPPASVVPARQRDSEAGERQRVARAYRALPATSTVTLRPLLRVDDGLDLRR